MRGIRRGKGTTFPALNKIQGGHKFEDGREVARRLTTQDTIYYQKRVGELVPR